MVSSLRAEEHWLAIYHPHIVEVATPAVEGLHRLQTLHTRTLQHQVLCQDIHLWLTRTPACVAMETKPDQSYAYCFWRKVVQPRAVSACALAEMLQLWYHATVYQLQFSTNQLSLVPRLLHALKNGEEPAWVRGYNQISLAPRPEDPNLSPLQRLKYNHQWLLSVVLSDIAWKNDATEAVPLPPALNWSWT